MLGVKSSVTAHADATLWQKVNVEGRAKATYRAKEDCEISFQKGDSLLVEESETDWLRVLRRDTGTRGLCPVSYVDYDVPADRASSKDLLGMLDNMFEDTMASVDAEREEDEAALAAAAALEAEFSFDNIMNEVLAEQAKIERESQTTSAISPGEDGNDGFVVPDAGEESLILRSAIENEMSSYSGRSTTEDCTVDSFFTDDSVPAKPLPPDPEDGEESPRAPSPPLVSVSATSPRSVRRTLSPPTTPLAEANRRSSSKSPTSITPKPSPGMARSAARPVAKLLGDDGVLRCAKCSTSVSQDATFCKHCGSSLKKSAAEVCAACKLVLKPGASVCGNCGTRTSGSTTFSRKKSNETLSKRSQTTTRAASPVSRGASPVVARPTTSNDVPALALSPRRSKTADAKSSTVSRSSSLQTSMPSLSLSPRRSAVADRRSASNQPPAASIPGFSQPLASSTGHTQQLSPRSTASRLQVKRGSKSTPSGKSTRVILVGSGSSGGTPSLSCLAGERCKTCVDALQPGSKNRRRNPALLIQHNGKNILIDCGKSFRESWIDVVEVYRVTRIDAVVITHAHADAYFGLDDLREVIGRSKDAPPVPVYARESDLVHIKRVFHYMIPEAKSDQRWVSNITFQSIPDKGAFDVCGLKMRGLPLPHGTDCVALGFQFGPVVYFSDLSSVPEKVFAFLSKLPEIKVLIIDALTVKREVPPHLNLAQALAVIGRVKPEKAILTGMGHELNYADVKRILGKLRAKEGLRVKPGFDMLNFSLDSNLF